MEHARKTNMLLLSEFAEKLGARLIGDGSKPISGINTIRDADERQVCFLTSSKYLKELQQTKAAAVIVDTSVDGCPVTQVVVNDANRGLIAAQEIFAPKLKKLEGIHPTAVIDPDAEIDQTAAVGPHVTIAAGVKIGARSIIGAGCSVGENSIVGAHTRLDGNVVVYHNCRIGNACIIQANCTIGTTGFGYSYIDGQHRLIPHNGGVIIEDGVEIGANSCVDRAKFGNTVIGAGTKIDNLVQIAHNVQIGKLCLLAGQVGIAGSTKIGDGVVFGGQSGAIDNVTIGDGVVVTAKTVIFSDIPAGQTLMGRRARPINDELRSASIYQRLPELSKQVKELAKKVQKLDAAKDD